MSSSIHRTKQDHCVRAHVPLAGGRQLEIVTALVALPVIRSAAAVWQVGADGIWRHRLGVGNRGDFSQLLIASTPSWIIQQLWNLLQASAFEQAALLKEQAERHYIATANQVADEEDVFVVTRASGDTSKASVELDAGAPACGKSS